MNYYAQLNNEKICIEVVCTNSEIIDDNMIPLEFMDRSLRGKRYIGNGRWMEVTHSDWPLTELEQIAIDNALNLEYLVCLAESDI